MTESKSCVWLLPIVLGFACADRAAHEGGETGADTDELGSSCPLLGMYEPCTRDGAEGRRYCDEFAGALRWGPCQTDLPCTLSVPAEGCQTCELVDGVLVLVGSPTCECEAPGGLPTCERSECAQRWTYACPSCESFVGGGDCFSFSEGCSDPLLRCDLDYPCSRVRAQSTGPAGSLGPLEDGPDAALCVLSSLRDGVPGRYLILWGVMDDSGWTAEWIYAGGDGRVFIEWSYECPGCPSSGVVAQTGVLALEPSAFFDECLADPTNEDALIACLIGLSSPGLPPEGYLPPFVTGTCESLEPSCP